MIDLLLVRKLGVMNNERTAETIGILSIVMRVVPICTRLVDLCGLVKMLLIDRKSRRRRGLP